MPSFTYYCDRCGTEQPVQLSSEEHWPGDDYPPEMLTDVCGRRWDGCGNIVSLKLMQ